MQIEFNTAYGSGATVTSTRYSPPKGHGSVTISIFNRGGAITWTPYMIGPNGTRIAIGDARAVTTGNGDAAVFAGTYNFIEVDVANTNATAGVYSLDIETGGKA